MGRVFVSYSWKQGEWVWDRLVPVLKASGIEILIDRERFKAGVDIVGQMDNTQDQAMQHVLCLSAEYLASKACQHEMRRAIASDPKFSKGNIIPLQLDTTPLPKELTGSRLTTPKPLWIGLADDRKPEPWRELLIASKGDLGTCPVLWLEARDQTRQQLQQRKSVCLHVMNERANWRALMDNVLEGLQRPARKLDLDQGATKTRAGFVNCILDRPVRRLPAGDPGSELVELDVEVRAMASSLTLAISHFDHMSSQFKADADLFDVLRYLIMDARKLVLFVQTRTPFAALLPGDHRLSKIDIKTVELP
jgi:TIR domain